MKTLTQPILVLLLLVSSVSAEEFRQWNIIGGGHFEAKLTGYNTTTLTLENREGTVIDYPLANLRPSDQAFAREWQLAQSGGDKHKRAGAPFELILISSDRSEKDMAEYMADYKMSWPAFKHGENKDIVQRNGTGIPNLIITDADGNKLLDSYDSSGKFIGPTAVLRDFEKLLAAE
ncbi:MAG: hypothetical protein EA353_03060 [Puniceicoccaceae bacterium]|nr:MAG: hypothetical protein EA353_03060 [Puniceicoccaceae bacterium]